VRALVDFSDFLEQFFFVLSHQSQHVPQVPVDGLLEQLVEYPNVPRVELD
jgi:hypothetical protein